MVQVGSSSLQVNGAFVYVVSVEFSALQVSSVLHLQSL